MDSPKYPFNRLRTRVFAPENDLFLSVSKKKSTPPASFCHQARLSILVCCQDANFIKMAAWNLKMSRNDMIMGKNFIDKVFVQNPSRYHPERIRK